MPNDMALRDPNAPKESKFFAYKYAVFRQGVFYRWELPSDAQYMVGSRGPKTAGDDDVAMEDNADSQTSNELRHEVSLLRLQPRETYLVNDVLGMTTGPTEVEHIREPSTPTVQSVDSLLDTGNRSSNSLRNSSTNSVPSLIKGGSIKRAAFSPKPVSYRGKESEPRRNQPVHLNSTDGLVVVSAFLPVVLNRSDMGVWTADWDYEMLLSMQTHLRVTRVGIVKWRGWHGNHGRSGSPEAGVPRDERDKVEACLRPFNCVPVWVEPSLFGEM